MKAVWCLLLVCLFNLSSQKVNPPEFKLAFDYQAIDTLQNTVIKPFFEDYTKDLFIDKTFSIPFRNILTLEIANISVKSISIDWDKTHLLIPNQKNNPSVRIKNLTAFIMFDGKAGNKIISFKGKNSTLNIVDLEFEINFGFSTHIDGAPYAYIDSTSVHFKKFELNLTNSLADMVIWLADYFKFPKEEFANFLLKEVAKKMNDTLVEKTTWGLNLDLLGLDTHLTFAQKPYIFNLFNKPYQAVSVNVEIKNPKTNATAPVAPADLMPDYISNDLQVQFLISENLIQQILWSAFDAGLVNLNLSNADMPESLPISLNTSDITILLPNIERDFGANKGIYLQILAGKETPLSFIRDGRLLVEVDVQVNFWVDKDSSQYPTQGLANCTKCVKAISLDTKALASLVLYRINATNIGVKIINAQVIDMTLLSGDVDPQKLASTLNNLLVSILLQLNVDLASGIPNPLIGMFGVKDMSTTIITDYLFAGLSLEPQHKFEAIEI